MSMLSIKALPKRDKIVGEFEFRDGFKLRIRYVPQPEFQRTIRESIRQVYVRGQMREQIDEQVSRQNTARLIEDWSGLTPELLGRLCDVDTSAIDAGCRMPATEENKLELIEHVYGFGQFVLDCATDLSRFQAEVEETEAKN